MIYDEQGFGDSIQFVRFLHRIEEKGGKVILETSTPLFDLFQQFNDLSIVKQVIKKDDADTNLDSFDYHYYASLNSLPYLFDITLDDIPAPDAYLTFRSEKTVSDIGSHSTPKRRVGIVWAGSKTHRNDKKRSLDLDQLRPLLSREDCEFYSLQVGRSSQENNQILQQFKVCDLSSQLTDFSMTASAIQQLDLIITVDTSVAHLAGALGRPVWTLLSFVPDWRWLLDRVDSPWYSSMRLFRQSQPGNWNNVLVEINQKLDEL